MNSFEIDTMAGEDGKVHIGEATLMNIQVSSNPRLMPEKEINDHTAKQCLRVRVTYKHGAEALLLLLWGKMADSGLKNLWIGRRFSVTASPVSYMGRVWDQNNEAIMTYGKPVRVQKIAFNVNNIKYH